ncbi:PIG-L deacetylase family protein [Muricoccus nepalensis]|uniref:PIG-L deacetylase family protein n=1 Tax=Muricoccus nepalensis TaxID=1854500 RepID=UPI0013869496|nr:PIG-L family deacetylase [Roseomonas nepalensis]
MAPLPIDAALPEAGLDAITGDENILVLALQPGDESLDCGGLIALSCRRGRQPFVMVLHDGSGSHPGSAAWPPDRLAAERERETREAVRRLGLRPERLLMAGLFDGPTPEAGPVFEAVVNAVSLVTWARDCNLVVAPWPAEGDPARRAAHRIAAEVARRNGLGHLSCAGADRPEGAEGWRLGIAAGLEAKRAAVAAHASQAGGLVADDPAPRFAPARLEAAFRPHEVLLRPPP